MLIVPLRLRPVKNASGSATLGNVGATSLSARNTQDLGRSRGSGVFIPGADASRWLALIAEAAVPHHLLELVVVPQSPQDRTPVGLLVILPQRPSVGSARASDAAEEVEPTFPRWLHCIEYRCWFKQLWLPTSAELDVSLSEDQFLELASPGVTYVWHPTAGLIGADAADVLGCADLLRRPGEKFADWNLAVAAPEINSRLRGISLKQPPSFDSIMDTSREDIGESTDQIDWRPKPPRRGGVGDLVRSGLTPVVASVAKLIVSLAKRAPRIASTRTWINEWEDWAKTRLSKISDKLYQQQHQELLRLLDMLSKDPDRGLKFAFPMDAEEAGAYRGLVPGGGELTEHDLVFDLDRSRGGGLAAAWYVPVEIQQALITKYRELATREIALRRYKRAAYIYAHLLGDLAGAARVLESGKHYREAATVYADKLRDRMSAARCLELAGAWSEAISLLEALHLDEQAGDLYIKLNQPQRAAECYRRVVERHRSRGEYIAAAKIEEEKLGDRAAALITLSAGFQRNQPVACLTEILRILSAGGQHAEARNWIERTRQHAGQMPQLLDILRLLSSVSQEYPDPATQHQAADTVRQLISQALAEGTHHPMQNLLEPLASLSPSDRLLSRDCRRYAALQAETSRAAEAHAKTANHKSLHERIMLVNSFRLHDHRERWGEYLPEWSPKQTGHTRWLRAVPIGHSLIAFGVCGEVLIAQRVDWDGKEAEVRFFQSPVAVNEGNLIVQANTSESLVVVMLAQRGDFWQQVQSGFILPIVLSWKFDAEPSCSITLVPPEHIAVDLLGLAATSATSWAQVRWQNQTLVLETVSDAGITSSLVVQHRNEIESLKIPVPLFYDGWHVLVAAEREMKGELLIARDAKVRSIQLPSLIREMASSMRHTRSRIALSLEQGVVYLSNNLIEKEPQNLCHDFEDAKLQFIRTGHLIVASNDQCEVYDTKNDQLLCVGACQVKKPFAILRTNKSEQFATISPDGEVCVYRVRLS